MLKIKKAIHTISSYYVSQAVRLHIDFKLDKYPRETKIHKMERVNQAGDNNIRGPPDESNSSVENLASKSIKEIVKCKRKWRYTEAGNLYNQRYDPSFNFTVMSYNILSQTALECHSYLYWKCKPKYLSENYRLINIIDEIRTRGSDVICLQEVEEHVFAQLLDALAINGYQGVYKKRTGDKTDGCSIFWLKRKFQLVTYRSVEFRIEKCEQLDRDNVGLIVCLQPFHRNVIDVKVHIATTHVLYNPRRGDIKFCQLRLLLAELDNMAFIKEENNIREYHPIILCGDFNFEPDSPLYNFLESSTVIIEPYMMSGALSGQFCHGKQGRQINLQDLLLDHININQATRFISKNDDHAASDDDPEIVFESLGQYKFYHSMYLKSSRKHECDSHNKPMTSMTGNHAVYVDHLFYSLTCVSNEHKKQKYTEDKIQLLGSVNCLSEEDLWAMGGLPNAYLSSDHIYIMSKFLIPGK